MILINGFYVLKLQRREKKMSNSKWYNLLLQVQPLCERIGYKLISCYMIADIIWHTPTNTNCGLWTFHE